MRPQLPAAMAAAMVVLSLLVGAVPTAAATAGPALSPPTGTEPSEIVVEDGVTQPVFSYADAIREVVRVESSVSSENGEEPDLLTVDIIRPAASEGSLRVPTILVPSPYYRDIGRGRLGEKKPPPGGPFQSLPLYQNRERWWLARQGLQARGPIDFFPLYYDNVFVPRGYAVALVDLPGSRGSTGCLDVGGPAEIDGTAAVVEWLAGKGRAVDEDGVEVTADWSNGKTAVLGKSWDATIAIGVAARAPEGLATIVPIAGLSHWHSDFWTNGARYGGSPTLWHDRHTDTPDALCTDVRDELAANQENPDPSTPFWQQRNWVKDVGEFEASVFIVHGKNDYNVKPANFGRLWEALTEYDVPRKMWLSQVEHQKAFDFRRDEWLQAIHRWFDYWLHDIDNGIMEEPPVEVEHAPGEWTADPDWPLGTATTLWLADPDDPGDPRPAVLSLEEPEGEAAAGFQEVRRSVDQLADQPFAADDRRLVFLSAELSEPVRVSGETMVSIDTRVGGDDATLSALLVDYGTAERVQHTVSGGVRDLETTTCYGEGTETDTGCYPDVELRTHVADFEVVTRGWVNAPFVLGTEDIQPGETYRLTWGLQGRRDRRRPVRVRHALTESKRREII